jgi:heme A synthase
MVVTATATVMNMTSVLKIFLAVPIMSVVMAVGVMPVVVVVVCHVLLCCRSSTVEYEKRKTGSQRWHFECVTR